MFDPIDPSLMDEEAVRMERALKLLDDLRRSPVDRGPHDDALQAWLAAESMSSIAKE